MGERRRIEGSRYLGPSPLLPAGALQEMGVWSRAASGRVDIGGIGDLAAVQPIGPGQGGGQEAHPCPMPGQRLRGVHG